MFTRKPTIVHVTHQKAGSQWVYGVVRDCVSKERTVKPTQKSEHFAGNIVLPGMFYPTVYLNKDEVAAVLYPLSCRNRSLINLKKHRKENYLNWIRYSLLGYPVKGFVVIRDMRDTLISFYYSLKISHAIINPRMAVHRDRLNKMNIEDGLCYAIDNYPSASVLTTWAGTNKNRATLNFPVFKYEEILDDEVGVFRKIMDHCEVDIDQQQLTKMVELNRFELRSGRQKGDEDDTSHYRKGIVGDWVNYFSETVKTRFKQVFGDIVVLTRYEKDNNW